MLKKAAIGSALVALLVALAVPAMADNGECCEDTVDVYLTIMPYCCVQIDGDIEVVVEAEGCQGAGPFTGCGSTTVRACANFHASLEGILAMDTGAPGNWSLTFEGGDQGPIDFIGELETVVTVCVDGIQCEDEAVEQAWVGTLTMVVCPGV